ncbi:MAG: hypothetical protein K0R28_159 [Paenibacillus sp.]|nr:hypothetical protein [Paenibacillus sp.]
MESKSCDIIIIGGGSGGFAAAIRAARTNPEARIMLVEAFDRLGGTSTVGGVNNWEPGVAGLGVHYELFDRMKRRGAIGLGRDANRYSREKPYGLIRLTVDESYDASLRRSGSPTYWVRVPFEPEAMAQEMEAMLLEAGSIDIRYRTVVTGVKMQGRKMESVQLNSPERNESLTVHASHFIDCTGGVHLARLAGCRTRFGEDSFSVYGEPSAPEEAQPIVNGVTLVFRVEKVGEGGGEKPEFAESRCREAGIRWTEEKTRVPFITEYPNGDLCFNLLPIMEGAEFHRLPPEEARAACEDRALAFWHWFKQQHPDSFSSYRFHSYAPLVGIRESNRLVGRHVLIEQEIRAGCLRQPLREEIIAFADHALDTHGHSRLKHQLSKELDFPYGIPYSCLLPQELDNLITATRGSSFSHIAASSCRLSRTMMALGEAAGIAAALAVERGIDYPEVYIPDIQEWLQIPQMLEKIIREWNLHVTQ